MATKSNAHGPLSGLFNLPELTQCVAENLDPRSLAQFEKAIPHVAKQLELERKAGVIVDEAIPSVQSSGEVGALIERIQDELPTTKFRIKPLIALGAQIYRLPMQERPASMKAFLPIARCHAGPQRHLRKNLLDTIVWAADQPVGERTYATAIAIFHIETFNSSAQAEAERWKISDAQELAELEAAETRIANEKQ